MRLPPPYAYVEATAEFFICFIDARSHPGPFVVVDIKKGLEVCHS